MQVIAADREVDKPKPICSAARTNCRDTEATAASLGKREVNRGAVDSGWSAS